MRRRTRAARALAVCLGALARGAHAEAPPVAPAAPSQSAADADADATETVEALFERADERFAAQDYSAALPLLERACAQTDFLGCELNLGAVHHALRHCDEAQYHYERYLLRESSGERAEEVRAALAELAAHCQSERSGGPGADSNAPAAAPSELPARDWPSSEAALPAASTDFGAIHEGLAPPAAPPVATPATPEDAPRYRAIAASVMALGAAAGLTSAYLGVRLANANREFDKHKTQPYDAAQAARLERAHQYRALTVGSGVASALLLGVGGMFWWLGVGSDADVAVAVEAGPEIRVGARF